MFGCASFAGTDPAALAQQLSYLHHFHPAPEHLRPRALENIYVDMNILPKEELKPKEIFATLPPLVKGYLRVGATIGDGAVIDRQFNTTDVCIVVQTTLITKRYRKYYERKIQKTIPGMSAPKLYAQGRI
jgi:putative hemolysin